MKAIIYLTDGNEFTVDADKIDWNEYYIITYRKSEYGNFIVSSITNKDNIVSLRSCS